MPSDHNHRAVKNISRTWQTRNAPREKRLIVVAFVRGIFFSFATINITVPNTRTVKIKGTEMNMTPSIAQFSEYALSRHAHATGTAAAIAISQSKAVDKRSTFGFLFEMPARTIARATRPTMTTSGKSIISLRWPNVHYIDRQTIVHALSVRVGTTEREMLDRMLQLE
jgi:hypothetical protein